MIPDRTKKAIINVLTQSIAEWTEGQTKELQRIRQRAKELKEREDQAKAKISEAVRRVNKQKQTILTAELLRKIQYRDMDVVHRILTGFPLVGTMTEIFIFKQRQPGDILTGADTLWLARTAEASRADLIEQVVNTRTDDVPKDIDKTTTDNESGEVTKGWADGVPTPKARSTASSATNSGSPHGASASHKRRK